MKKHLSRIIFGGIFFIGLFVLLYPHISRWYNKRVSSYVVSNYDNMISTKKEEDLTPIFERAEEYNRNLLSKDISYEHNEDEKKEYMSQLSLSDKNEMMGYIEIKKIDLKLPIYHGTSQAVLQEGVGHLEWTALPVGGVGNHSVLTGHRGLPTAKLFTNLDKLVIGDTIKINVLGRILYYDVKDIVIIEPSEVGRLEPVEDRDLLTLVTCTPYGVNSHRLLITCERTDNPGEDMLSIDNDATLVNPYIITVIITILVLIITLIIKILKKRKW